MKRRSPRRKPPVLFSEIEANDRGPTRLDAIEHKAASIDPDFAARTERWMPGAEPEKTPKDRGLYDWMGTEDWLFSGVPTADRRVCAEWLRGARQTDIARRCKVKQRTVRRIVADFKKHLMWLAALGRFNEEDLEEYIALLGGDVALMIARIKQAGSKKIESTLPEEVRAARREKLLARLERDRHGTSVIGLPPLAHRTKLRRKRPKR